MEVVAADDAQARPAALGVREARADDAEAEQQRLAHLVQNNFAVGAQADARRPAPDGSPRLHLRRGRAGTRRRLAVARAGRPSGMRRVPDYAVQRSAFRKATTCWLTTCICQNGFLP